MLYFVLIALGLFCVAGFFGWRRSDPKKWTWVDVVYYPLVSVGVVVFFYEVEGTRAAFVLSSVETLHVALVDGLLGTVGAAELSEVTEAALAESRENLVAAQARQAQVATLEGIRSVAWPGVILLALSMKFAKGVAAYRTARAALV
ncbi:MAG: hypothetical protein AAGA71_15795 [Pseudomonadota bacterium]